MKFRVMVSVHNLYFCFRDNLEESEVETAIIDAQMLYPLDGVFSEVDPDN